MISSHYSQSPSKYQILSMNYFQMRDKTYCRWELCPELSVKLIKRHISDHWSHLWREAQQSSPPSNNNLQQISCQIPGGGWGYHGICLAQTFLALLNNIPVVPFHTKQKQWMNGMFDLPNSEYFWFIFLKTDSVGIVLMMDSITDLALDIFHWL